MPVKKAAKKGSAKYALPEHRDQKELRRAYEHLGRVQLLRPGFQNDLSSDVNTLRALAETELGHRHLKEAAELLRVAEHLSFAALAGTAPPSNKVSIELKSAVKDEVDHLISRALERWNNGGHAAHPASLVAIFNASVVAAEDALASGSRHRALELARGAEALTHLLEMSIGQLGSGVSQPKVLNA